MTNVRAISLFSGLGGLDLGARAAGADVVLATDLDDEALKLLRLTQGTQTSGCDISGFLHLPEVAEICKSDVGLVIGGPPCVGFSHAGFWLENKRNGEDPSTSVLDAYVDAIREVKPAAFVLENVPGLRFKTYRRFYDSFVNRARRAGYAVSAEILDARDFGVPQARRRLFVVGVRGGPQVDLGEVRRLPSRNAEWAIGGLVGSENPTEPDERPTGIHAKWLEEVPPGENYLVLTERRGHPKAPFEYRSRYWSFLLKASPSHPVSTIPAQRVTYNGPFHWSGRHLRIRELTRLQTLPDWQALPKSLTVARRMVGNAVPPLLAASVVEHVLVAMGARKKARPPRLLEVAGLEGASFEEVSAEYPGGSWG